MLSPGTRIRMRGNVWPEREGCEGVVVDPEVFGTRYPNDRRIKWGTHEVVVLLDKDPLGSTRYTDERWTCVVEVRDVEACPSQGDSDG